MLNSLRQLISIFVFSLCFSLFVQTASAQATVQSPNPRAPGTAIVGLGLIGTDAALALGAISGIRSTKWVLTTTGLGLTLGVVGGIFFESKLPANDLRDIAGTSFLVIGMGGVIPSVLVYLQQRANDVGRPIETVSLPPALLQLSSGKLSLGSPMPLPLAAPPGEQAIGAGILSGSF